MRGIAIAVSRPGWHPISLGDLSRLRERRSIQGDELISDQFEIEILRFG
jgi:hypothetical protein